MSLSIAKASLNDTTQILLSTAILNTRIISIITLSIINDDDDDTDDNSYAA